MGRRQRWGADDRAFRAFRAAVFAQTRMNAAHAARAVPFLRSSSGELDVTLLPSWKKWGLSTLALMFSPLLSFSREGTVKAGDRILSLDGMPLNREKHADALTMLMQSSQEALFLIEYDISVMGERTRACTRVCTRGRNMWRHGRTALLRGEIMWPFGCAQQGEARRWRCHQGSHSGPRARRESVWVGVGVGGGLASCVALSLSNLCGPAFAFVNEHVFLA